MSPVRHAPRLRGFCFSAIASCIAAAFSFQALAQVPATSDQAKVDALFAEPAEPEVIAVQPLRTDQIADGKDDPTALDTSEVTGSRLSRADFEGALPVTVINRDNIAASGKISVADALRSSTFNSFGSYTSISGSTGQGQSVASLRGLGSFRTLVLVDGRRIATSPSLQGSGVDLNTIPLAAVERIEVLSDGASAVYGSDAIGGVINVILHKDFNGVEITAGAGRADNAGGDENDTSIVGGISSGDSRMMFAASYTDRDPIYLRDRDYSRAQLGPQNADGSYNFSQARGISFYGNTVFSSDFSRVLRVPDAGCPQAIGFYRMKDDVGNLTGVQGADICGFDFSQYAADTTKLSTKSLFVKYGYDINVDLAFEVTASYSQSDSFGRFAQAPDFLFVPGTATTNPFGEDVFVAHRFAPLGTRDNNNQSGVLNILPVLRYSFDDSDIEVGARISRFRFTDAGSNYLQRLIAAAAAENGSYNPFDFSNPGEENVLNAMKVTTTRNGLTEYREAFSTLRMPLFELAHGVIDSALGIEYRKERYYDKYDSQSEAGVVGGSSGNSSSGSRNAYAVFGEVIVPVLENLEVDVAARYDDYSGSVGSAFSPKISARWQAMDNLTVRASAGKGFRAPLLSELNANDAFSAESARDLVSCRAAEPPVPDAQCAESQYDTFIKANPNLKPEKSTQFGIGIAMQPAAWADFTLDYYNIEIKDSVTQYSAQSLIFRELLGQELPDNTAVNRLDTGRIDSIETTVDNLAKISTDGFDFSLNTHFDFAGWGAFNPSLNATYVLSYKVDDGVLPARNEVEDPGQPEYRLGATLPWTLNSFTTTWNTTFIPSTAAGTDPGDPNPLALRQSGHVASNTVHDVQLKWDAPWNGSLVAGIRDVFDRGVSPNFNLTSPYYDQTLYTPTGRMPYVRIVQRF